MSETTEFRKSFRYSRSYRSDLESCEIPISCYRGTNATPRWKDVDSGQFCIYWCDFSTDILLSPENYSQLCIITADLQPLAVHTTNPAGTSFYKVELDIVLSFGLTELKAQIAWRDKKVWCLSEKKIASIFFLFCHLFHFYGWSNLDFISF